MEKEEKKKGAEEKKAAEPIAKTPCVSRKLCDIPIVKHIEFV